MKRIETPIEGLFVLRQTRAEDDRGVSTKCYSREAFREAGVTETWDQTLHVSNTESGTLRGMHWQTEPLPEEKVVQCLQGRVFDVAVDVRPGSVTFKRWFGIELSDERNEALYIASGIAHGYVTLEERSHLLYHIAGEYRPEAQRVFRWDDEEIGIEWPVLPGVIARRDAEAPLLAEIQT